MTDGAHAGIDASRALKTILGGEAAPTENEGDDAATVRAHILAAAKRGGSPADYGDCADMVAGMVLMFYGAHPEALGWPASPTYHYEKDGERLDGYAEGASHVRDDGPSLYDEVNAFTEGKLSALGISGFQWGWAVNAARFAESLPPEPNPALLTVTVPDGAS